MEPEPEPPAAASNAAWLDDVGVGTEMGERVRRFDWTTTSLGHPSTWPDALRTAVRICVSSRFPMLVVWGPDLVKIYNDGYVPILGDKHPAALGAPAAEVWAEIWDELVPRFDAVLTGGGSTWDEHSMLLMERHGYAEEAWFTWSYSPLRDDDDRIAGVLDVVFETTHEILAERRLACISALSAALLGADKVTEVCRRAASVLGRWNTDIVCADIYLRLNRTAALVATNRPEPASVVDTETVLAISEGAPTLVIGGDDGRSPAEHVVTKVAGLSGGVDGVLVATLDPHRAFDEEFRAFIDLVSATIGTALDSAYRRSVELDEHRVVSDTLQQAMLRPASDLPNVAARYLPAAGELSVGGDWYDVIDVDDHTRAIVVGDCVGHGLDAAAAMGQMRAAARAMLLEGRDPAETLTRLDRFAATIDNAFGATLVCAVIDRRAHTMTYASAGHPPPLLVGDGGVRWLDAARGTPLAVDDHPRRSATVELANNDLVVLYSDGLVERRDESIDVGLERLATAAAELHGQPVHRIADELLRRTLGDQRDDDVVLVVKLLDR